MAWLRKIDLWLNGLGSDRLFALADSAWRHMVAYQGWNGFHACPLPAQPRLIDR